MADFCSLSDTPSLRASREDATLGVGEALVHCLSAGDFAGLQTRLATDVRLRALLPGGPIEVGGDQAVAGKLALWFGDVEVRDLLGHEVDEIEGRLHTAWRFQVSPHPVRRTPGRFAIRQDAWSELDETGRICSIDLLCSGFRAVEAR